MQPLYSDDVLLFINNLETCIPILLDLLGTSGTYAGYKLNLQKTQVVKLNRNPSPELKQNSGVLVSKSN